MPFKPHHLTSFEFEFKILPNPLTDTVSSPPPNITPHLLRKTQVNVNLIWQAVSILDPIQNRAKEAVLFWHTWWCCHNAPSHWDDRRIQRSRLHQNSNPLAFPPEIGITNPSFHTSYSALLVPFQTLEFPKPSPYPSLNTPSIIDDLGLVGG